MGKRIIILPSLRTQLRSHCVISISLSGADLVPFYRAVTEVAQRVSVACQGHTLARGRAGYELRFA